MRPALVLPHALLIAALSALTTAVADGQSGRPPADVLAAADQDWSAGKFDDAFDRYQAVLRQDSTSLRALFRVATVLGWRRDLDRSVALFRVYLRLAPTDDDARLGLARTLAWRGQYDQASAICDSVLARDPRRQDALQLAAQTLAWSVARAPSLEPIVSTTDDSDRNRALTYLVRGGLASLRDADVGADASYRVADFGLEHGTSMTLHGSSTWSPGGGTWTVRTDAGAARVDATAAPGSAHDTRVLPLLGLRITERPSPTISIGGGVLHAPFDETASLMRGGIATTSVGADGNVTLGSRLDFSGDGSWTRLTGGSGPNSRLAGSGSLRWSLALGSIAASVRGFGYDHSAFDGYFAPKGYVLAEMSGRVHVGGQLGWGLDSELGLGNQTIVAFDNSRGARFAQRASLTIAYRPAPGFEWTVSAGLANVASPTTISSTDYRAYTLAIKARVKL